MTKKAICELCGEPMPPGEEMFKYHGYSGDCPKPPLPILEKRPVAWRVRDCADGWIIYQGPGGEEAAYKEAESRGALMQGLYVRDGT